MSMRFKVAPLFESSVANQLTGAGDAVFAAGESPVFVVASVQGIECPVALVESTWVFRQVNCLIEES
jgi:hypothetical protein